MHALAPFALAVTLMTGAVQAAVITQTVDYDFTHNLNVNGSGTTPFGPARALVTPAGYFTANLATFDTSLGTLNSVTVNWSIDQTMSLTNASLGNATVGEFMDGATLLVDTTQYGTLGNRARNALVASGASATLLLETDNVTSFTAANAALFSRFTDGPDVRLLMNGSTLVSHGRVNAGGTMVIDGLLRLTYDYTPRVEDPNAVPEPGSLALAGAAMLALVRVRQRRRR